MTLMSIFDISHIFSRWNEISHSKLNNSVKNHLSNQHMPKIASFEKNKLKKHIPKILTFVNFSPFSTFNFVC